MADQRLGPNRPTNSTILRSSCGTGKRGVEKNTDRCRKTGRQNTKEGTQRLRYVRVPICTFRKEGRKVPCMGDGDYLCNITTIRTHHEDIGKSNSQHRPALPTVSTGRRTAPRGHMVPVKLHRNLCLHSGKLLLGHPTLRVFPFNARPCAIHAFCWAPLLTCLYYKKCRKTNDDCSNSHTKKQVGLPG